MNELGSRKVRLLLLVDKAQTLVRLASSKDCDLLFLDVAAFASRAVGRKKRVHEEAAQISLDELLSSSSKSGERQDQGRPCSPFGVCDPSLNNDQLCFCCDDGSDPRGGDDTGARNDSVDACAQCLCLLRRHPDINFP